MGSTGSIVFGVILLIGLIALIVGSAFSPDMYNYINGDQYNCSETNNTTTESQLKAA